MYKKLLLFFKYYLHNLHNNVIIMKYNFEDRSSWIFT